jgi:hypothetical protein
MGTEAAAAAEIPLADHDTIASKLIPIAARHRFSTAPILGARLDQVQSARSRLESGRGISGWIVTAR